MSTETIDLSKLSKEQLKAALKEREQLERNEQIARERAYEKEKETFIEMTVKTFIDLNAKLSDFKTDVLKSGKQLHKQMYDVYNKEEKQLKSFSLTNEAGTMKLEFQSQERQAYNETADVAVGEIKKILREKFAKRNKVVYNMLESILMKNKKGEFDERMVSKLRAQEQDVNLPEFSEALDILSKSFVPIGTSLYVRAYIRETPEDKWNDVHLQFSAL